MTRPWLMVPLGGVLTHRKEFIRINDLERYKRCRVQLHAQGVVLRDVVIGAEIKTKQQQVCKTDDLLVAEIDAKHGGYGLVLPELDGAVVSSHYFLFDINTLKLNRDFLRYFICTPAFRDQVEAQGSTNYAAIRPAHVLGYHIPLPPLEEQRRIVARIEAVAAKVEDANATRTTTEDQLQQLLASAYHQIADGVPRMPLSAVAPLTRRPITVDVNASYPQVSVRSFGRGSFHKPALIGNEVTWEKPHLVKAGDILISNIKAWEGAIAVASDRDDGRFGSHRYLTCVPIPNLATARFICFHLLTPEGLYEVGEASPGSADRNRTLSSAALQRILIPVPSFQKQLWFDTLCNKIDALKTLQAETQRELDALLPSVFDKAFKGEL